MSFPIIHLPDSKITKNNLTAFNLESANFLKRVNDSYTQIALWSLGITTSTSSHAKALKKMIKHNKANEFREQLISYQSDCKLIKEHKVYLAKQTDISEVFETIKEKSPHELLQQKKKWLMHNNTSHYTSEALISIATSILGTVENYYAFAKKQTAFFKKKMNAELNQQLEQYLELLKNRIQAEKNQLCQAMLGRLQVASEENDLKQDDITNHVIKKLANSSISIEPVLTIRRGLSPTAFTYFHHYITDNADPNTLKKMKNLVWLKEDANYVSCYVNHHWAIVPNPLCSFLPAAHFFPWNIFYNRFVNRFLSEKFYVLALIRTLPTRAFKEKTLIDLLKGSTWQELNSVHEKLSQEENQATVFLQNSINKLFFPKRCALLAQWKEITKISTQQLVLKKLSYAISTAEQLRTRVQLGIQEEILLARETKESLLTMIADIEASRHYLDSSKIAHWLDIKKLFLLIINKPSKQASSKTTCRPTPLPATRSQLFNHIAPKPIVGVHLSDVRDNPIKDVDHLIANLKKITNEDGLDLNNMNFMQQLVDIRSFLLSERHKNQTEQFKYFWQFFFIAYLMTNLHAHDKEGQRKLAQVSDLIRCFASEQVRARAAQLEEHKENKEIYEIHCNALLFSFRQQQDYPQIEVNDQAKKTGVNKK